MTCPNARADALLQTLSASLGGLLSDPKSRARVSAMLALVTRVGPDLRDAHLLNLVRLGLATFLFDDVADRGELEARDVVWRAEQLAAAIAGELDPELAFDPAARLLHGVSEELRASTADRRLFDLWVSATQDSFRAMATGRLQADRLRAGEAVTPEEIEEVGQQSMAVEALCALSWAMLEVPFEALAVLLPQASALAGATRLANDLRSLERDREEGAMNPLLGLSPAALAEVPARIEAKLASAGRVVVLRQPVARAAALDAALARAIVGLYAVADFSDLPAPVEVRRAA